MYTSRYLSFHVLYNSPRIVRRVMVSDGGHHVIADLYVTLNDVNDNRPQFVVAELNLDVVENSLQFTLTDGQQHVVVTVRATFVRPLVGVFR